MDTLNRYALQLVLVIVGLGIFALSPSLPSAQTQVDPETVVLYAADAPRRQGAFDVVQDATAAGGQALRNLNANLPRAVAPLSAPPTYAELTFEAESGKPYHLWIRARATNDSTKNDSIWMQFSGTVAGLNGAATYRIGTTSGTWLSLEEDNAVGVEGWGWTDNGFGMNVFGPDLWQADLLTEETPGTHAAA